MAWLVIILGALLLWVLLNLKTSRCDGTLLRGVHPYRRIMAYIMPTRAESVVYFDSYIDATELARFLPEAREAYGANVTHCVVAAVARGMHQVPQMNRFVVGRRLYERKGVFLTFSMKRKKLEKSAKVSTVKLEMPAGEGFQALCARLNAKIQVERSDRRTYADKEFAFFTAMPRPVLNLGVKLLRLADYNNLLPWSFIRPDPMFTSAFIANLGSLGMAPGFHHLFEWGTCPLFLMVGRIEDRPAVVDGAVQVRPTLHLRWTYDERIDDGLTSSYGIASVNKALEDPFTYLGCLDEKGADARPLDKGRPDAA